MSRAFTKERDDAPEPPLAARARSVPAYVTPAGRALLEQRLAQAVGEAERDRLEQLIATLVVVYPPADRNRIAFGAEVEVRSPALGVRRFTLVGPDEADVGAGRVSVNSPLGTALLGARAGDRVMWHRPAGDLELTVNAIHYPS